MIKKWKLIPEPCAQNKQRQQLLLQCDMKDVFIVIRELGKICSRPQKSKGEYNFTIYLSEMNEQVESKLNEVAESQGLDSLEDSSRIKPKEDEAAKEEGAMEINPFLTQPGPPVMPNVKPISVIDSDSLTSDIGMQLFPSAMDAFGKPNSLPGVSPEAAASAVFPSGGMETVFVDTGDDVQGSSYGESGESEPIAPIPDFEKLKEEEKKRAESHFQAAKAKKTQLPSAPVLEKTARIKPPNIINRAPQTPPEVINQTPQTPQTPPEAEVLQKPKVPEIKPKEKKQLNPFAAKKSRKGFVPPSKISKAKSEPEEKTEEPKESDGQILSKPQSLNLNTRWNIELALIPTQDMNSMLSGSHNRFAHAAAMAVVETPGTIYNPLIIHGPSGSGKTHFVNLIAQGLFNAFGYEGVFVTSGIKFSKGVDLAVKKGKINQLQELFSAYKAIVIDDMHLMMLTEANKPYISKWLNNFIKENKQIVITTALPTRALGYIEDALNFQFSQGWSVDLKQPSSSTYRNILNQILHELDISLNEGEIADYFVNPKVPLTEAHMIMRDVLKLEQFTASEEESKTQGELLEELIGLKEEPAQMPSESELQQASQWKPSSEDLWLKWGIFYPKGAESHAYYAMYSLFTRSQQMGLGIEWQQVFLKDYDPSDITASAFGIGNFAASQNVNGIIILGAPEATEAFDKESEFKHFVLNILADLSLKTGWVPYEKVKSPAALTKAVMELM